MAESTEIRDSALPHETPHKKRRTLGVLWSKIKLAASRSIFWSYERGTWQYDVIVLAILAFIFLTPRSWFQDRPTLQLTDLRHTQGLVELGGAKEGWSYLVDARLVDSLAPLKPEEAIHEILRRRLPTAFTVRSIEVLRDSNNVILGYRVAVER